MTTTPDAAIEAVAQLRQVIDDSNSARYGTLTTHVVAERLDVIEAALTPAPQSVIDQHMQQVAHRVMDVFENADDDALAEEVMADVFAAIGLAQAFGADVPSPAPPAEGDVREFADFDSLHEYLLDLNYEQGIEPELAGYDSRGIPIIAFLIEEGGDATWPLAMVWDSDDAAHPAWSRADLSDAKYPVRIMRRDAAASGLVVPVGEVERLRRWKSEALPIISGLQEVGRALGLGLGQQVTGRAAVDAALDLQNERDDALAAKHDLVEAIRFTAEYAMRDTLPAIEGWSWYDALVQHAPEVVAVFREEQERHEARREATPAPSSIPARDAAIELAADLGLPADGPTRIPARSLSGEHVGRVVRLPDGTEGALNHVAPGAEQVVVCVKRPGFTSGRILWPDDVVEFVDEGADQ